ncbi:hypothetical protein WIS52_21645 [Pseudonocardia nematodicida]|uniref:Peptidase C39-like domain-containing protein n=1 Tax=Pseudonocardia nematodicida TaxID=1206997 RepID=A0ABV1KF45_9PSEU
MTGPLPIGPLRTGDGPAVQADGVSCGPSVLVVTAALTGAGWPGAVGPRFAAAQALAHRQANRVWPRALGTTPWGMRAWLRRHAPAAGRYRVRRWTGELPSEITAAVADGRPVPLLVGSASLPRHWVLVTGLDGAHGPDHAGGRDGATGPGRDRGDGRAGGEAPARGDRSGSSTTGSDGRPAWRVYDPAAGRVRVLRPDDLLTGNATRAVSWPRPWAALLPVR